MADVPSSKSGSRSLLGRLSKEHALKSVAWVAEFLSVGGNDDGFEQVERESLSLAPNTELSDGAGVGSARVPVADVGGEELDEAARGIIASGGDESWQGVSTKHGGWYGERVLRHGQNLI